MDFQWLFEQIQGELCYVSIRDEIWIFKESHQSTFLSLTTFQIGSIKWQIKIKTGHMKNDNWPEILHADNSFPKASTIDKKNTLD